MLSSIEDYLLSQKFSIINKDVNRPWGGFFVLEEDQSSLFINTYFDKIYKKDISTEILLSPKILIVAPGKRLSWQYHHRRKELWKVIGGSVGVVKSLTDDEAPIKHYETEDFIQIQTLERHRLIGLDNWGIVAEIWQHTEINNPSNEEDIVRVQDDFGR